VDHCATGNSPSSKLSKYNAPGFDAMVGTRDAVTLFAMVGTGDVVTLFAMVGTYDAVSFEATVGTAEVVPLEEIVGTNDVTFEMVGTIEVSFSPAIVGVKLDVTGEAEG
jgi:gamma-glutamylcysteine synthetase